MGERIMSKYRVYSLGRSAQNQRVYPSGFIGSALTEERAVEVGNEGLTRMHPANTKGFVIYAPCRMFLRPIAECTEVEIE